MIDAFKLAVILISSILWGAWLVLALRKKDVHPLRETLEGFSRLGWMKKVGVLFIVVQLTMFGGAKHGGTNDVDDVTSTNDVELVEGGTNGVDIVDGGDTNGVVGCDVLGAPQPMSNGVSFFGGCGALGTVRPTVAVRPYRLESVLTNEGYSYAMPSDGTIRGTWHLTGAYEDVQKVALDGFAFPLGSDLCTSLWAYTWGKVRPQLKNASNEIAAVGAPMSAIPDMSRFWTAATSNGTYLLTWENFAAGRQSLTTNNQQLTTLSAQLELRRNGDFITRSNDVECVWRRRLPCDLDDDGWIDIIDPTPEEFDENGFGPHQTLPVGDNTNYYYWVDLVVDQANARVTFEGEGHSALPDPDFIARAGETNRVMLLIGKTYVVHCDLPVRCVGREDDEVCVWDEGRSLGVLWPIYLDFVPTEPLLLFAGPLLGTPSNGGGDTGISVHPERAGGGDYSWPDNFCCYTTAADGSPIFCCDGNCGCGGCYTGDITYRIGEHELAYGGWSCGCSHEPDDPHGGEEPPDGPPAGPSVSATFSHDAIIFEDAYENSPGVFVPRRSTEVEAEFYVYGGTNGGSYAFTLTDGGRLRRLGGSYVPRNGTVKAGEDFHVKVRYDAVSASGSEGDIKAKVEFTENGSGRKLSNEAELTAVKVSLTVAVDAPANACSSRHQYGVCEKVNCSITPSGSAELFAQNGASLERPNQFRCPIHSAANTFEIRADDVSYTPSVNVIEPADVEAVNVYLLTYGVPVWCAGGVGLQMQFRILPLTVSFSEIAVEEVPSNQGDPRGYFAHPLFNNERTHTRDCGAGVWSNVDANNISEGVDSTGLVVALPRMTPSNEITDDPTIGWVFGTRTWALPFGWNVKGTTGETAPYCQFAAGKNILFTIDEFGTVTVTKLGYTATRSIDGLTSLVEE